jgi:hypothetical protein
MQPIAKAAVRWIPAAVGGRQAGPPTAPVYAATAVFQQGGEAEVMPGWPTSADHLSILVRRLSILPSGDDLAEIAFLAPDLAKPYVHVGAELLVMEGPKVVAQAVVQELL